MSVANVSSKWVDGNLVLCNANTGEVILTFDATNNTVTTTNAVVPGTQADNQADLTDVTGAVDDAALNVVIAAVNELKDALVLGGIMASA